MYMSAIFLLDNRGKVLMSRNYRDDISLDMIEGFMHFLLEQEDESNALPIVQYGNVNYVYTKHLDVYVVGITDRNTNVTLVISFLLKIVEVFKEYFDEFEEESIRDNFVIIYELLDEFMDFGFPQITESKMLKKYITQEGNKLHIEEQRMISNQVTNAVSWRPDGIVHRRNEVFLDVIESLNLLVNASGTVVKADIKGTLNMRVYLSGRPELRLGLNDKVYFQVTGRKYAQAVELEDMNFHQCVRLSRFEHERTISFIPPDGEFELMSYRLNTQVKPLIMIESVVERFEHSRIEYMLKAKSLFKRRNTANNVEIILPVPSDVDGAKFKASIGYCKYLSEKNCVIWTIKSFPGSKEYLMRAHFNLPSVTSDRNENNLPIQVKFEIPYYTISGIQVRYLKIIEKNGYSALPWVRYLTKNGDYFIRIQTQYNNNNNNNSNNISDK